MKQSVKVSNLKLRNDLFANYLSCNGLVIPSDVLVEITKDVASSVSISECLQRNNKIISIPNSCNPSLLFKDNDFLTEKDTPNFICNGVFSDVDKYVFEVLNRGSFNIGICSSKEDVFYGGKKFYKKLRGNLFAMGIPVTEKEDVVDLGKIYLLSYRANAKGGRK